MVSVSGYLIGSQEAGKAPLPPKAELQWWYQYYFATERGRAGYAKNTHDFAKLIWRLASPKWNFDDATFNRSAASLDNPDHVDISIHNYRWRLALAEGEPKYAEMEKRLAEMPVITVPTITIEGDANGAPHPDPASYANKFSGKYSHRTFSGGIGHNPPQEAPQQFAEAVLEAARCESHRRFQLPSGPAMRTCLMIALAPVAFISNASIGAQPARAANGWGGSYCLGYREGGVDCSFTSYAQCSASASGIDASCFSAPHAAVQPPIEAAGAGIAVRSRTLRSRPN
jgi:hypothetical protein